MTIVLAAVLLFCQQDSSRAAPLDTVLVTAERVPMALGNVSSAVTRIDAAELAHVPHATFADVLRLAPGFALVDFDGLGFDPQLMVRGFYGGGQAEYVVVLLDGQPLNQLHTGLVAWDALPPPSDIEAVEILRGSASALYGDAAIGGVINVITRRGAAGKRLRWSLAGGTHSSWRASVGLADEVARRDLSIEGSLDRTDGFRRHAQRTTGRVHGALALIEPGMSRLTLSAGSAWRNFDEPGPLLDSLLTENREASDALFRFDHTQDRNHTLGLDGTSRLGERTRLSGSVAFAYRAIDAFRTIALAPGFGDTKKREITNRRMSGMLQLDLEETPLPLDDHLTVGAELSWGWSDSRYYAVVTGDRGAYLAAAGTRGALDAAGDATRDAVSLFAQYTLEAVDEIRLSLGVRFDRLVDTFAPQAPTGALGVSTSHSALSPKAGLNLRYLRSERLSGNAYVTASRSFKAATLDQLFDQRSIPIPFPPFSVTTSNAQLVPQYGTSIEAGLYQGAVLAGDLSLGATLSVYQIDMKDELDFDVQTLRYVNIGRSRHRGIEAGLTLSGPGVATAFTNYTLQAVTARSGPFAGNALKAIPRHAFTAGIGITPGAADARLTLSHARNVYLDDANTVVLPAHSRVDGHLAYQLGDAELFVNATNLFGARYHTTGFLDPAGTGQAYLHPAAGRVVRVGVRSGR